MMKSVKRNKMMDVVGLNDGNLSVNVPAAVAVQFKKLCEKRGISVDERIRFLVYADSLGMIDEAEVQKKIMGNLPDNIAEKLLKSGLIDR